MKLSDYLTAQFPDNPALTEKLRQLAKSTAVDDQRANQTLIHARRLLLERVMALKGMSESEAANYIHNAETLMAATKAEVEWEANVFAPPVSTREVKSSPVAIKMDEGTARFTGLASPFGGAPDSVGDVVDAGAYKATIAEAQARGNKYLWPLLWQHDPTQPIGGILTASETPSGLRIEAQIAVDTDLGRYAQSLLAKHMISGLSIGYVPVKVRYDGQTRRLVQISLQEISIVTFPAASSAQVTGIGH